MSDKKLPTHIIMSGQIASGTSSTGKALAKELGYTYIDGGQIVRQMAAEHNLDIVAFQEVLNNDPEIDQEIENRLYARATEQDNVVLNAKVSPWYFKQKDFPAFYLYLEAPIEIRKERIMERDGITEEQAEYELITREAAQQKRYMTEYSIDRNDLSIYNLIINTSQDSVDKIVEQILEKIS